MRKQLLLCVLLFAITTSAAAGSLRDAVSQNATSIAWKIQTHGISMCCCREGQSWINGDGGGIEYRDIILLATLRDGKVTNLRMLEPNCPLEGTRLLTDVPAEESIDFLLEQMRDTDHEGRFVAALAMHDHPRAIPELIRLGRHHASSDIRRHALFWLGQRAGEKAAAELRRAVDDDPQDEVREHAVFAISQLPPDRSIPILIDLVKHHKRPRIRKRAMFWLAQTGDPRAMDLVEEILGVR
jgi:HEAT repeat protein